MGLREGNMQSKLRILISFLKCTSFVVAGYMGRMQVASSRTDNLADRIWKIIFTSLASKHMSRRRTHDIRAG
jgi:hypothetical protein